MRCSIAARVIPASGELVELLDRDDSMGGNGNWESSSEARESRKLS